jgi:peptide/nickel transport system substrate-binding protein
LKRRELLRGMGYAALSLAGSGCHRNSQSRSRRAVRDGNPRKGGRLRIGELGSSADTLDAARYVSNSDQLRAQQLYDGLTETDQYLRVRLALAEEFTAESPTQWLVRLKPDLHFHNGKPVTADDVMFSIRRIIDPKKPYQGSQGLAMIDADSMRKLDERTLRLSLHKPNSFLPEEFSQIWNPIVPVDFDPRTNVVGTGPYRFKSFTPGSRSLFTRNPDYWREAPYFDEIAVIDFTDDTARLNALIGGEIDVMPAPPHAQMQIARAAPDILISNLPSSAWEPFCLRADVEPFSDPRVRQALRLIPDRQQFITQVYNGNARLGNDLFGASDPYYADGLPQRMQDLDQAKSLLRSAGHPDLDVEIVTASISPTAVQAAEVYAEQAKAAGVTVRLRRIDPAAFYGSGFLKRPFTQDSWSVFPLMPLMSLTVLPGAGDNETGWNDAETIQLIDAARATSDPVARKDRIVELQRVLHDRGGYIIPALINQLSFYSDKICGLPAAADAGVDFNFDYRKLWFAA